MKGTISSIGTTNTTHKKHTLPNLPFHHSQNANKTRHNPRMSIIPYQGVGSIDESVEHADKRYRNAVADVYNHVSQRYNQSQWHHDIARDLVEYAAPSKGNVVVDVATGTGIAAFLAGEKVGSTGRVIGVDIATDMLAVARYTASNEADKFKHVEFVHAAGEKLEEIDTIPKGGVDLILCSSAFIWLVNLAGTLRRWKDVLKPGGQVAVHCFPQDAFIAGVLIKQAAREHSIEIVMNEPTGTVEKCTQLFQKAGFVDVQVEVAEDHDYLDVQQVLDMFSRSANSPMCSSLQLISEEHLAEIKSTYDRMCWELEENGKLYNNKSIMYVKGFKPQ